MNMVADKPLDQTTAVQIRTLQDDCALGLERLARTCCLSERSERMQGLKARFAKLDLGLKETAKPEAINANIDAVEKCGEAIGGLFATCCTPTREKLYLQLMKNLNNIHTNLWKLKGISH